MSEQLPRRRTLESLKKEAKRWLSLLRQHDADARARFERALTDVRAEPTLRDVQHALAREQGFDGWIALTQSLDTDNATRISIDYYEAAARALFDAYYTGTPEAMEEHYSYTWHRRAWPAMRTYVQLDLGLRPDLPGGDVEITPDDARYLVAAENGFESWQALADFVASASATAGLTFKPVGAFAVRGDQLQPDESTEFRSRDWLKIIEHLRQQPAAGLFANGQMTDKALRDIARVENVEALQLSGSKQLTDVGLRALASMPRLRMLDLSGTNITDRGLEVLEELPNLESIRLSMSRVTDAGVVHLARCEGLRRVDLIWTNTGDGALRALRGKTRLTHLSTGNHVSDDGLAYLRELPAFAHRPIERPTVQLFQDGGEPNALTLRGAFTDRGMQHVRDLGGLYKLDIDDAHLALTAAAMEPLVALASLNALSCDAKDDWMPAIARMPSLRWLGIQDTVAGDDGFVALGQSRSIERIWGRRCHNLRTRGFKALANMPALRSLSVSCLNVEDEGIASLPTFPALRELMPMDIPDAGYRHIGKCEQLDSLILMYCRDTTDAATGHIVSLPKLTYYFNSYTEITDRTPQLLSAMNSLERITFDACPRLTNAGVASLARLPRLRELRVAGRKLTPSVADAFPDGVSVHYSR